MYVKINRNACGHHISKCERCLGKFLENPLGYERQCFEALLIDGKDALTLDITSGDNHYFLVLDDKQRETLAGEGWAKILEQEGLLEVVK
jgi:hypothetical protein